MQGVHNIIDERVATKFMENNVVGKITKTDLDDERVRETADIDMMLNNSIFCHPGSILEL
jgi:hypothetical protein